MDVKFRQISETQLKLQFNFKSTEMHEKFEKLKTQTSAKMSSNLGPQSKHIDQNLQARIDQQTRSGLVARVMQESITKVVEKFKIKIVSTVDFKFSPWNDGEDFSFTAQFEMNPKIKSIKVPSVKFKDEKKSIPTGLVEKSVLNLLRMHATLENIEKPRKIKKGDIVILDIDAFEGKRTAADGSSKGFQVEIKEPAEQSFLEKQVLGLKQNDTKSFEYDYEFNFPNALLAGKKIKFNVKVVALKKMVLPKLDAAFVRKVFLPHDSGKSLSPLLPKTVDDLHAFVRKELEFLDENKKFEQKKIVLLDRIIAKNPFEIPKALHAVQKQSLIKFETELIKASGQNINVNDHLLSKDSELTVTAEKMVRSALIIDFLARRNNIDCSDNDIEEFISDRCRTTGEDKNQIIAQLTNQNLKNQIKYAVLEKKVVEVVLKKIDKDVA